MALKQTRRAVSISRSTYDKLKELSRGREKSMAQIVDRLVRFEYDKSWTDRLDLGATTPGQKPPA